MLLARKRLLVASAWLSTCFWTAQAATLDISDGAALQRATASVIRNLFSLYVPDREGVFEQASTPWFASGILYDMVFDYARWTGDDQFNGLVTAALANVSFGRTADILNGASNAFESLSGKWNDDIGHMALALTSGAELYGIDTEMPGIDAPWLTVPQKTLWQMEEQLDDGCGGGIYWSRNRLDERRKNYKSAITNWQYTDVSLRLFFQTKNQTLLTQTDLVYNWLVSSGLAAADGTLGDGVNVGSCVPSESQWSYNYGLALGTVAWHYKISQDPKWLATGSIILNRALGLFAPNNIVTELCEAPVRCNRDQQHFKGILLRNMAYYFRVTDNEADKEAIRAAISGSIDNMVPFCNDQFVCPGNWTDSPERVAHLYPADLGAASSLLVSALGVYHTMTGTDLIPQKQLGDNSANNNNSEDDDDDSPRRSSSAQAISSSLFATVSLLVLVSCTFWTL